MKCKEKHAEQMRTYVYIHVRTCMYVRTCVHIHGNRLKLVGASLRMNPIYVDTTKESTWKK